MDPVYDHIIVGAGSAGCVLASRLSADAGRTVLLLEAGAATQPGREPADILDPYPLSSYNSSYFWPDLKAYWGTSGSGVAVSFPQAHIMGGGSAVAGMVAFRGTPDDYAEWEAAGAKGWSWQDVEPYFRKLEADQDYDGPCHGRDGPIPIRRIPREQWPALSRAIERYAHAQGLPSVGDMNADFRDGFGATPISNTPRVRVTTAAGYLSDAVRRRPNLRIVAQAFVRSLCVRNGQVGGVLAEVQGQRVEFQAREVIVSAGAIHSPALLQRSGIGDGAALHRLGIPVVADRRGVGRNLRNHAALFVGAILRRGSRQPPQLRTHPTACMRLSSGQPGAPRSDLYINIQSKTSWNAMGLRLASLNAVLLKPMGAGQVSLHSPDPAASPVVEFGFGEHPGDVERLATALLHVIRMVASAQVAPHIGRPFAVRVGDRIRKWNAHTPVNALKAQAFAALLDLMPACAADRLLAIMTGDTTDLQALAADPQALLAFVRREMSGVYHPVGSCRMGRDTDPDAVVDPAGQVIGVRGLRVVDASIMPTIPRGNTNIPTIMAAEKLAAHIAGERMNRSKGSMQWTCN